MNGISKQAIAIRGQFVTLYPKGEVKAYVIVIKSKSQLFQSDLMQ